MDKNRSPNISQKANRKFLQLLDQARLDASLSQREVAALIGCHPSYILKIENGTARFYAHVFIALFSIYDKPLKYYFSAFDKPNSQKKK
ncbi:XRE family transcriptional regulator [Leptospira wolffii]|uniref:helix-turn-helix domain-containing protein n=1 Tax=Leptospira wolffii TaxID=409998 RepID=UPI0010829786|nr:XRE family transcriptional regulator [Leptospira wolffii]